MTRHLAGNLSSEHCRAICDEIGERLAFILKLDKPADLPPKLAELLERLSLQDCESPSIVPMLDSEPNQWKSNGVANLKKRSLVQSAR
jgi:hypothetical protein